MPVQAMMILPNGGLKNIMPAGQNGQSPDKEENNSRRGRIARFSAAVC